MCAIASSMKKLDKSFSHEMMGSYSKFCGVDGINQLTKMCDRPLLSFFKKKKFLIGAFVLSCARG